MKTIKKLILVFAALLVMASCGHNRFETMGDNRFETISYGIGCKLIYDKETKVEYVMGSYGNMCVLVDADGKPLLYQEK